MQDYRDIAHKNGFELHDFGSCQFCGAQTTRGIHECVEIFSLSFQGVDFSKPNNHQYRFFIVDAHTLQHPEIHGRWSNHFHLTRLHLIFTYKVFWTYQLSPKLSDFLNAYKIHNGDEYLLPPEPLHRGEITSSEIKSNESNSIEFKGLIERWAMEVYMSWGMNHEVVDKIAKGFLHRKV